MSRRKREAIAQQAAVAATTSQPATRSESKSGFLSRLKKPKSLAAVGIGLLFSLTALGAVVGAFNEAKSNGNNFGFLTSLFASSTSTRSAAAVPLPSPSPSPVLSKQLIYAGSKLLAQVDAGASSSQAQAADLVVWRLTSGTGYWYVSDSANGDFLANTFGQTSDIPLPADFDGNGLADFCIIRPNDPSTGDYKWYIQSTPGGSFTGIQWGLMSSDTPAPADYDGDGRADIAIWRSGTTATFLILNSSTSTLYSVALGQTNDKPMPADYDGDGKVDPSVYRSSNNTWYIKESQSGSTNSQSFGQSGDEAVTGDYDGDGKFDLAVRRDSANQWLYRPVANTTTTTISLSMQSSDKSVPGDYDNDGKTDAAVYRDGAASLDPSYWYIRKSTDGTLRTSQWGMHLDKPVPAPFKRS